MEKIDSRVKIKGTVSKKTADSWKKGDLVSNNGLRNARGRASYHFEQPDFELDETPDFASKMNMIGENIVVNAVDKYLNDLVMKKIVPLAEDTTLKAASKIPNIVKGLFVKVKDTFDFKKYREQMEMLDRIRANGIMVDSEKSGQEEKRCSCKVINLSGEEENVS